MNCPVVYLEAYKAGMQALRAVTPTPMVVQQHRHVLDDNSPVVRSWFVPDGVCGFAWVNIKPANCAFAKWLREQNYATKDSYLGGVSFYIHEGNQSYEKKRAFAAAFAQVLSNYGIRCYSDSRLD